MTNARACRQEGEGEQSHPRASPVLAVLGVLALVVCCGLPFLIIAAGGLASLSLITGRYALPFAGGAIVVSLVIVVGIAIRTRNKREENIRKTNNEEACCE